MYGLPAAVHVVSAVTSVAIVGPSVGSGHSAGGGGSSVSLLLLSPSSSLLLLSSPGSGPVSSVLICSPSVVGVQAAASASRVRANLGVVVMPAECRLGGRSVPGSPNAAAGENAPRRPGPCEIDRRAMQHLNLWKQQLGRVPEHVWDERELETLVLADNGLEELDARIGRLARLRMLDVGHNRIATIPAELGDVVGLSDFLYLHDNRLTTLPDALGRLVALRYLNLGGNAFTELPAAVLGMRALVELRAEGNAIAALPEDIGELSALRELALRDNRLTGLPAGIAALTELRVLDLRGNPLVELPESICTLPRLDKLDLRWTPETVRPSWLARLEARGCLVYR